MKKRLLFLFTLLLVMLSVFPFSELYDNPFKVEIDSLELIKKENDKHFLNLKVTITNTSSKNLKFQSPHPQPYSGFGDWKLTIYNDKDICSWRDIDWISYRIKEIKIKPGKSHTFDLGCDLEKLLVNFEEYEPGIYHALVELRSIEQYSRSVFSNTISFEIK